MAKINTNNFNGEKTDEMAKQEFRPTRRGGFSREKVYIWYAEVLKNRNNTVGWTFCDAINGGKYV